MRQLLCLVSLLVLSAASASAQITQPTTTPLTPPDPALNDPGLSNQNRDPNSFGSSSGGFNMMNLIHQANLGGNRNLDQYRQDRDRNIDQAVSNFNNRSEVQITPKLLNPAPAEPAPPARP
ncbi:hypothetical protein [Gloeobacter kilaueensis]|uniref:Uncharacterized protein n=1 Tax=Gloeobacter kilaueensis (strain ATCC BAA-2537 / CCAP 1431/1 / ULC 316 / JS1) TaxID=1183438 RepID=U5QE67_GLOK1|nr:hypothetical protein [Gloeobacter kilaueensis]AGY57216.1 hypothetical protein GKIL_0970 [Gloeobacter kilaueensis JS1]